jgi:hypothetical protein
MKVKELIAHLSNLDPELSVYVSGYEGGYDDLVDIQEIHVMRDLNTADFWWEGAHDYDSRGDKGVLLPRPNRLPKE